jgi:hypothetical protein
MKMKSFFLYRLHSRVDIYMCVDYIYYLVSMWLSHFSINPQLLLNDLMENIQTYTLPSTGREVILLFYFVLSHGMLGFHKAKQVLSILYEGG